MSVGRNMMKLSPDLLREARSQNPESPSVPVEVTAGAPGEAAGLTSDVSLEALLRVYSSDDVHEEDVQALMATFPSLPRNAAGLVLLPPTIQGFRAYVQKQLEGKVTFEISFEPSADDVENQASRLGKESARNLGAPAAALDLLDTETAAGPLSIAEQQNTLRAYLRALPKHAREHAVANLYWALRERPALLQTVTVEAARFFEEHGEHYASIMVAEAVAAHPDLVFAMEPGEAAAVARALSLGPQSRNTEVARTAAKQVLELIADRAELSKSGSAFALELIGVDSAAGLDQQVLFAAARHLRDAHTLVLREAFASRVGRAAFQAPGVAATQKLELLAQLVELDGDTRASLLASTKPLWGQPAVLRLFAERLFAASAETQAVQLREMRGTDLETSVGMALHLTPDRPQDTEEQEALELDVAAGLRSPYVGENKTLTETIAAQIRRVGGDPPEVAVVSVAFMSEHSGVRSIPLFKVRTADGGFDYVDRLGRRYATLYAFERENPLPPGLMVASDDPLRAVSTTPNGQPLGQALAALDLVVMGAGTVAGVATLLAPNPITGGVAVAAQVYMVARSGGRLVDRATHGQSLSDREAGMEWLVVVGGVAGGASPALRALASRTRFMKAALRGEAFANGVALLADAELTAESFVQLRTQWDDLSPFDRMSLSLEIGFFAVGAAQAGRGLFSTSSVRRALRGTAAPEPTGFRGAEGVRAANAGAEFLPGELVPMQSAAEAWVLRQADAHPDLFTTVVVEDLRGQIASAKTPQDFADLDAAGVRLDAESRTLGEHFLLDPSTPVWRGRIRSNTLELEIEQLRDAESRVDAVRSRLDPARDEVLIRVLDTGTRGGVPLKERFHYVREELASLEGPLPAEVSDELAHLQNSLRALEALEQPTEPPKTGTHTEKAAARHAYDQAVSEWRDKVNDQALSLYDTVATVENQLYTLRRIEAGVRTRRIRSFPLRLQPLVSLRRRSVHSVQVGRSINTLYSNKAASWQKRGMSVPEPLRRKHVALLDAIHEVEQLSMPRSGSVRRYFASRAEVKAAVARFDHAVAELTSELRAVGTVSGTSEGTGATANALAREASVLARRIGRLGEKPPRANLATALLRLGGERTSFEHQVFVSGERAGVPADSPHSLEGHGRRLHGELLHPGTRDHDSEVQILERVREMLLGPEAPAAKGSLVIYSDNVPCPSCQRLLARFKEQFPDIEVEVRYVSGEEMLAARKG